MTGDGGDVFEVGVVVEDDCAVLLGHGSGQEIDHAGRTMMITRGHADLYLAGTLSMVLPLVVIFVLLQRWIVQGVERSGISE